MADSKITALTAISTVDPTADPLVIVDVSDTSMAASGTTKKSTINQLLGAGGTATLASATITGDLTVDTSTLKVDSANNRVIVGHTSGSSAFQVTNAGAAGIEIQPTGFSSAPLILSYNRSAPAYTQLTLDGSTIVHALNGSTAMTLNSTGLGVGVVPSAGKGALQLSSGINFPATQVASSDANTLDDYEEGTFTPNITGTGVTGITYTTQSGVYTKIGRVVTFAINIVVSASTRAAAIFQIGNLPFSATGSVAYGGIISYSDSGFFATAASNKPNLLISSTDVVFYKSDGSAFNGTDIAANAFAIRIAGTYFTA